MELVVQVVNLVLMLEGVKIEQLQEAAVDQMGLPLDEYRVIMLQ